MTLFWLALAVLVLVGWLLFRSRMNRSGSRLTDDAIEDIEERGWLATDEPLDLEDIQDEERQFWTEDWEEPEPW